MMRDLLRQELIEVAQHGQAITYQALAKRLAVLPPHTIQQVATALEGLMEEDAAAGRPLIAALVVGKATGGVPRLGFFECAQRVGCFYGAVAGPEAISFHEAEFRRAVAYWG